MKAIASKHCAAFVLFASTSCTSMCGEGREVPGDPRRFDPVESYAQVAAFAGSDLELELVQISAIGVRADGTLDLEEERYDASVDYHFVRDVPPPDDAPPVGAGGGDAWHQTVRVHLRRAGHAGTRTDQHGTRQIITKGMQRIENDPTAGKHGKAVLAPPRCSLATAWKAAKAAGAPPESVATVTYMANLYDLRIKNTDVHVTLDVDCTLVPPR
jgi:hypothetical protein